MFLPGLLQLSSPSLPVGAYSYSQGLEWAVEQGAVRDEATASAWIESALAGSLARLEAPTMVLALEAAKAGDTAAIAKIDERFLRSRETSELLRETLQMGFSLRAVIRDLEPRTAELLESRQELSYPAAWGAIAAAWGIPAIEAAAAYLWSWSEGQVLAAVKAVPLGQASGQRMFRRLQEPVRTAAQESLRRAGSGRLSSWMPGLAIASARHETQYTRLFRS